MQFTLATVAAFAAFITSATSHLIMADPPQWAVPGESQAPLDPSGSDFPCQNGRPDPTASRSYTPGSQALLQIQGTAVHGGGSAQMLITYDFPPTANSVWRVMQSFEGDHPIKSKGNMQDQDPRIAPSASYMLPPITWNVPSGLPAGRAVVAWSWFNRMGNREMYMKCATVQINGAKSSASNLNEDPGVKALPTLFRANSGNGCAVPENVDAIAFKNPGPNPKIVSGYTRTTIACDNSQPGSGSGASSGTGTGTGSPSAPSPTTTKYPSGGQQESGSGDGKELPSKPTTPSKPSPIASKPVTKQPVTKQPVTKQPATEAPSNGSGCPEGKVYCNSDNTWSMCGSGYIQKMGPVPSGMKCTNGQFSAAKVRRAVRFSPEHIRRRH
ncbi:hypothetical protein K440DRAFT_589428 [Wilcoxina mikolae CBS 423.85]|nr:hypothetical protein K440DRAFT_589428 [Wilcoxina mikolae CBS 423.85]